MGHVGVRGEAGGTSCKCHSSSSCAQEDQDLLVLLKASEGQKGGSLRPPTPPGSSRCKGAGWSLMREFGSGRAPLEETAEVSRDDTVKTKINYKHAKKKFEST